MRHEQAAAADVADVRMVAEALRAGARAAARRASAPRRAGRRAAITCCTASAAAQATGWPMYVWPCWKKPLPRASASTMRSLDQHARRSAGSRRPGPWRSPSGRGRCPPARPRAACRCGPCRTSPRRRSAGCRGGRRSRARAGSSPGTGGSAPGVAPPTVSATNAITLSRPEPLDRSPRARAPAARRRPRRSRRRGGRGTRSRATTCVTSISSGANWRRRHSLPPTASAPSVLP